MRTQYHTRTVGDDRHSWDVHGLCRLAKGLPVQSWPLDQIAEVDELWWFQDAGDTPTPRSIAAHMALVAQTDLRYPIILCAEGRLMDGMHRVVKAITQGHTMIDVVQFPQTPSPDYVNVDVNTLPYLDVEV